MYPEEAFYKPLLNLLLWCLIVILAFLILRNLTKAFWRASILAKRIQAKFLIIFFLSVFFAVLIVIYPFDRALSNFTSFIGNRQKLANLVDQYNSATSKTRRDFRDLARNYKDFYRLGNLKKLLNKYCIVHKTVYQLNLTSYCKDVPEILVQGGTTSQVFQGDYQYVSLRHKNLSLIVKKRSPPLNTLQEEIALLSFFVDKKSELKQEMRLGLAALGILALFSGIWLGIFFGKSLSFFLNELIYGIEKVSKGDLTVKLLTKDSPEFSLIKRKFNGMVSAFGSAMSELEKKNLELKATLENIGVATALTEGNEILLANTEFKVLEGKLGRVFFFNLIDQYVSEIKAQQLSTPFTFSKRVQIEDALYSVFVTITNADKKARAIISLKDITDLIEAERYLVLKDVVAKLSHEVFNPLTPIESTLQDLIREASEEVKPKIQALKDKIIQLKRFIKQISGPLKVTNVQLSEFNLLDLVFDVVNNLPQFEKKLNIICTSDASDLQIRSDILLLSIALKNVIENAMYYAWENSTVEIKISESELDIIIRVSNQGPQIDPHLQNQIFEPYFTTKPDGTGLGLYLSRVSLNAIGGSLKLKHSGPEHTIFELRVPKAFKYEKQAHL